MNCWRPSRPTPWRERKPSCESGSARHSRSWVRGARAKGSCWWKPMVRNDRWKRWGGTTLPREPSGGPAPLPRAITIAGSDSGGGAGIQADLKTFAVLGVWGTSAITSVTVQNTLGVRAVSDLPPDVVAQQIEAVATGI